MSVSRRGFLQGLRLEKNAHAASFLAARGHEEDMAEAQQSGRQGGGRMRPQLPPGVEAIRISSNENPLGPGKAAIDAILGKFPEANRYPFNSTPLDADLEILIAKLNAAKRENVVLGVGSQELLKNAVRVFMSPTKHLVEASPTYGNCAGQARQLNWPIKTAPVDAKLRTDLAALLPLVKGAGLVYLCNPNNPTGTIVSSQAISDFVAEVRKASPTTAILIDEAYCDYVTDPSFQTAIPLALATPGVLVARTFSKAYGMAGVRIGYAVGDAATIKKMAAYRMPYNVNTFGVAAAVASLKDPQHIKEESGAQQGGARLHGQGAGGPGLHLDRFAVQLHLHRHRQDDDGRRVPRRVRRQGRDGRPRLPAAGKTVGSHLARHDGRDAEGHRRIPQRAQALDDDLVREGAVGETMAITRRQFVQTAGIGAGAALTSNVWGRGRENSVWSAFDADLQAVEKGMICIASNENPVGPGKKVLDSLRALLEGGAKPGRYSNQTGELTEAICAHFKVKPENVLLSEGSTEILRAATQVFTSKTKPLVGTIPTYEECAGYAELIGNPVKGVSLNTEFKLDVDKMAAAAKGAGLVFYCNPNNPTATYVGAKATRASSRRSTARRPTRRSWWTRRTSTTSRTRITTRTSRSPSRIRASSSRARSRRRTGWRASARATRSRTRTPSRRCASGRTRRAPGRSTCSAWRPPRSRSRRTPASPPTSATATRRCATWRRSGSPTAA